MLLTLPEPSRAFQSQEGQKCGYFEINVGFGILLRNLGFFKRKENVVELYYLQGKGEVLKVYLGHSFQRVPSLVSASFSLYSVLMPPASGTSSTSNVT